MKSWWGIPYGILIGLLAAGVILLVSRQPRGKPIELMPSPTPSPLFVYINGAVKNPGVYALPLGSRVADAVQAAGGFAANAGTQEIDLAAKLIDGQTIQINFLSTTSDLPATNTQANPALASQLININLATQEELESLPGIGPELAERIVKYRTSYGLFMSIEDILAVYGLTEQTFELIKNQITTGSQP